MYLNAEGRIFTVPAGWLTLTLDVFKLDDAGLIDSMKGRLTLTLDVFKYNIPINSSINFNWLTLTLDVFKSDNFTL